MLVVAIGSSQNQDTVTDVMNEKHEDSNQPHVHEIGEEDEEG